MQRGKTPTGDLEQPEYFGGAGQLDRKPWVRDSSGENIGEIHREIDQQDSELNAWARGAGDYATLPELLEMERGRDLEFKGAEHNVWMFDASDAGPFVIRATKCDMFGMPHRTPAEYFARWLLFNQLFPDAAVTFICYTQNARGNGVIFTSQRYIDGTKKSQQVITRAMARLGFIKQRGTETSYIHASTGIEIHDAKPDNVIFDRSGNMIPIDVWVNDPMGHFPVTSGGGAA
jgi:Serine/Threonine/Tyrosine Kinase found in polyvalent proteins